MVAAGATKLSPGRSAQQNKTEIEQIPDKLEFGLVFLLLFCSLMFFFVLFCFSSHFVCAASEIFSHFSYCCFCRFVVFFLPLFLQHFHARFRLKYSLAIMIISTLRFTPSYCSSSFALPFEKWHFTTVVICFCSCFLLPSFLFSLVRMCDLAATQNNVGWLRKLWVSMWFVVIGAMSGAWWTIYKYIRYVCKNDLGRFKLIP